MRLSTSLSTLSAALLLCVLSPAPAQAQVDPAAQTYTADAACFSGQDFCLTGIYSAADQAINYTMVVASSFAGWRAVGQGSSMRGSNMLISWVYNGEPILSHRGASGRVLPTEAEAISTFTPQQDVIRIDGDKTIISWTFPQTTDPGSSMSHIWALHPANAPTTDDSSAGFGRHTTHGEFSLDFSRSYDGEAPAVPSGVSALASWGGDTTTTSSGGEVAPGSDFRAPSYYQNRVWQAHIAFMIMGWLFFVPAGVMVARFGRLTFKWFPAHRGLQLAALLFVLIGFFCAVGAMESLGWSHFSERHHRMGLAATILLVFQAIFGQLTHVYKHKAMAAGRKPTPFVGIAHAIVGLATFTLSVATIHTGFQIWDWWNPPSWASIPIWVWYGVLAAVYLAAVFFLLPRERQRQKEEAENEKTMD